MRNTDLQTWQDLITLNNRVRWLENCKDPSFVCTQEAFLAVLRRVLPMIVQQASSEQSDSAIIYGMLRSELAAVEAYAHAIEALQGSSVVVVLERILREHQSIALLLREWERPIGITSTLKTGSWGFFASAVAKIAALIGSASLLSALKSGERYGESLYRHALGNPDLSDSFRFLIGSQLLPPCQRNIRQLERMDLANKPITSPETM